METGETGIPVGTSMDRDMPASTAVSVADDSIVAVDGAKGRKA